MYQTNSYTYVCVEYILILQIFPFPPLLMAIPYAPAHFQLIFYRHYVPLCVCKQKLVQVGVGHCRVCSKFKEHANGSVITQKRCMQKDTCYFYTSFSLSDKRCTLYSLNYSRLLYSMLDNLFRHRLESAFLPISIIGKIPLNPDTKLAISSYQNRCV